MLEFVLESRTIIKLSKETARDSAKEETLTNLIIQLEERFFSDPGLAVSDSNLREKLLKELEDFRGLVRGAKGVRQGEAGDEGDRDLQDNLDVLTALEGGSVSVSSIAGTLQEVYLDPSVWDKLDKFYMQFLTKKPTLPTLAVLLSIL